MYYLTGEDLALFREMAQDFRARKRGPQLPPSGPYASPQAPDVYLAKVPPGGIPGLEQSGTTGTGTDQPLDDVPGEVECEIYQLDTSLAVPEFGRVGELTYIVRNLSPSTVSADRTPWVLVVRDKFGEWYVAGGAGQAEIEFADVSASVDVVTSVVQTTCGLLFKTTPLEFTFSLPVGSTVAIGVGSGNTGTGSVSDGNDLLIEFNTQLLNIPTSASFTFDSATCTGSIDFTTSQICVVSGVLGCCPDYTGTGTG